MSNKDYGQYSVISYVHQLRGERVNLGVAIWHPRYGRRTAWTKNLKRILCIDADANIHRVERDMAAIDEVLSGWRDGQSSPLEALAKRFRHDLVVSEPLPAKVTDLDFLRETLIQSLIVPEKPKAKNKETLAADAFRREFVGFTKYAIAHISLFGTGLRTNFNETFAPDMHIRIAARFRYEDRLFVWRTAVFSNTDRISHKRTKAKAVYAENIKLKQMSGYQDARLSLALRAPAGDPDVASSDVQAWLRQGSDNIFVFEKEPNPTDYEPEILIR